MAEASILNPDVFSEMLYGKLRHLSPAVDAMELYEFRYALDNLYPKPDGWASVKPDSAADVEQRINTREFYIGVQLKPRVDGRIVLDENIVRLTRMLCVGLVCEQYSAEWIDAHFYFDVRGFIFLPRTVYFTHAALDRFGGKPYRQFQPKQKEFERFQGIGYKDFRSANAEVDQCFIGCVKTLIAVKGTPILITLAGPTAAGKTEITERLRLAFDEIGKRVTTIEMDSFLHDMDYRDEKGINSLGKEGYHFDLFLESLHGILQGRTITIPRRTLGISSHDADGRLRAGAVPQEVEPADIIFLEGNFPFQIDEIKDLIGIKVVYLTDDPVRLKRKWKRDIDYRKRYDPAYFCNRFFRTQALRAQDCYREQIEIVDLVVDTSGASLWATPEFAGLLSRQSKAVLPESL